MRKELRSFSTESERCHVHTHVCVSVQSGSNGTAKENIVAEIRKLKSEIPQVLESWVGRNESPRGQGYEMGGGMKFADKAAYETYEAHPVHQKLLGWLLPLIEPIEVDFNCQEKA
jgi:hypothetical protein